MNEPQHVYGHLREALLALPLAWPPSMGPLERKASIENVVTALDSLVAAKIVELRKQLRHEADVRQGAAWE